MHAGHDISSDKSLRRAIGQTQRICVKLIKTRSASRVYCDTSTMPIPSLPTTGSMRRYSRANASNIHDCISTRE